MGVFSRFMDIVNANINTLLDKAEDPEKMIKLMMQEMEDTLIELKSACAAKMASKAKLDRNGKELEALVQRWVSRAELAISRGREDLARDALKEKRNALSELDRLKEDASRYSDLIAKSKEDISRLEDKLQSLRQKVQSIAERAAQAREEQTANDTLRKASDSAAFGRFQHMEDHVDRMEANANLSRPFQNDVEHRFADLEELEAIEDELEAMRKQAGTSK
jgi:phage shock protein A